MRPLLNFQHFNFNLPKFVFGCKFLLHFKSPLDTSHGTAFPINPNGSHAHSGLFKETDLLQANTGFTIFSSFLLAHCGATPNLMDTAEKGNGNGKHLVVCQQQKKY